MKFLGKTKLLPGIITNSLLKELYEPLVFGSYLLKFNELKKDINKLFLYYFLKPPIFQDFIFSVAEGSTRLNTNAKVVSNSPLIIPFISEQPRIARVLSWFDELIENKKKQNEILEKTAMAIFKSWFIDFEPFKTKSSLKAN